MRDLDGKPVTFEISGEAGYRHDALINLVDSITVSNPTKMTWIYRTAKKNDKIDSRKQAILLSIGEVPKVHIPSKEVRQWRVTIQHRKKIVSKITQVKNRIRALLMANGFVKTPYKGSWWKVVNRAWMRGLCEQAEISSEELWRMSLADMLEELELLGLQLKRVTKYLDQYLDSHAGGFLLMSIPGVGPRTAEAVLAYTDDVRRFSRGKQYCAYFGLTPKLDESGTFKRLGGWVGDLFFTAKFLRLLCCFGSSILKCFLVALILIFCVVSCLLFCVYYDIYLSRVVLYRAFSLEISERSPARLCNSGGMSL